LISARKWYFKCLFTACLLLVSQVIYGKAERKAERKVNFDLLRFSHLTLPICAGIECQDIKQGPKTTKMNKGQLAMASQMRSQRRATPESSRSIRHKDGHGEAKANQMASSSRDWINMTRAIGHGEKKSCQAKKGGFILSK
jgi:hypothetical protein